MGLKKQIYFNKERAEKLAKLEQAILKGVDPKARPYIHGVNMSQLVGLGIDLLFEQLLRKEEANQDKTQV